ncbi:hypothetical protein E3N88_14155 [Mikania micrantha]|uniref:Uncharacterized protein n=1 Tax=Mikania micrantha TaxID=192012 RepID=A0A5N6P3R2_9ASTR|nr:hypothetical protein E3N88_14155 [Mikania micrantha]
MIVMLSIQHPSNTQQVNDQVGGSNNASNDEISPSEGTHSPTSTLARPARTSSSTSAFPQKFNDFVVEGKVKHGIKKVVIYSHLSSEIFCCVTNLNKSVKPTTYSEVSIDNHWVEAMNA